MKITWSRVPKIMVSSKTDVVSHQSKIKKFQVFSFFIIFIQPNDISQTKDYGTDRKALWDGNRKHHNFNITLVSYRGQLQEQ